MTEYFIVPAGKEPTQGKIIAAMDKFYDEKSEKFPAMYPDDPDMKAEWVKDMYPTFHYHVRAKVAEPLDTVPYTRELPDYGDLMTVEEWYANVECGGFIDYDGHGAPARARRIEWKDGMDPTAYPKIEIMMSDMNVIPSLAHLVPKDATHIVWFNR